MVTQNRMERAVYYAKNANPVAPHHIVRSVMHAMAPHFDQFQPADPGRAWRVPDDGGACQSITRFVEKVVKQIGCPGEFEHVNIYAIETNPTDAIEDDPNCEPFISCPCCGLNSNVRRHPTNPAWVLSLVAGGACNPFEAAGKFTYCNETRYYPGGTTGIYGDKDEVLYVFDSMTWVVEADLALEPPQCTPAPIQPSPELFQYLPKPQDADLPSCP